MNEQSSLDKPFQHAEGSKGDQDHYGVSRLRMLPEFVHSICKCFVNHSGAAAVIDMQKVHITLVWFEYNHFCS